MPRLWRRRSWSAKKEYFEHWPLIKILDIGGKVRATSCFVMLNYMQPVQPNFKSGLGEPEVPPIPCHIHSGRSSPCSQPD